MLIRYALSLFLVIAIALTGCGKDNLERVVETRTETVQLPAPSVDLINDIVASRNDYRLSQGLAPLVPGLKCTLHSLVATTPSAIPASPPAVVATFAYLGAINIADSAASDGLPLLPAALRPSYTSWYLVRCSGYIVITENGHNLFNLTSDDGSKLYIDGALTVNNDGNHAPTLVQASKALERGVHAFRLDYMQGPGGSQALRLENSAGPLPAELFYRE